MHEDTHLIELISSHVYKKLRGWVYGKQIVNFTKIKDAIQLMADNDELVAFTEVGTHRLVGALGFSIDLPWFSQKPFLTTKFIIPCDTDSFMGFENAACFYLKDYATSRGCAAMHVDASMTLDDGFDEPFDVIELEKSKYTFCYTNYAWLFRVNP